MVRPTTTWKSFERKVAETLHGQRVPASGNGAIKGDVRHDNLLIECKYGEQVPKRPADWYAEAERDAVTELANTGRAKVPVVVMKRPRGNALVLLDLDAFRELARMAGVL